MANTRATELKTNDMVNARVAAKGPELVKSLRKVHDALAQWTSPDAYAQAVADGTRAELLTEVRTLISEIFPNAPGETRPKPGN